MRKMIVGVVLTVFLGIVSNALYETIKENKMLDILIGIFKSHQFWIYSILCVSLWLWLTRINNKRIFDLTLEYKNKILEIEGHWWKTKSIISGTGIFGIYFNGKQPTEMDKLEIAIDDAKNNTIKGLKNE